MVCDVCHGCWGHALHAVLNAVRYAALYSGGGGGRAPFAGVLERCAVGWSSVLCELDVVFHVV